MGIIGHIAPNVGGIEVRFCPQFFNTSRQSLGSGRLVNKMMTGNSLVVLSYLPSYLLYLPLERGLKSEVVEPSITRRAQG